MTINDSTSHVLVVDDEPKIRKLVAMVLRRSGLRVTEAANGLEALAIVDQERVDLVISDVNMPKLSGIDLLTKLKERIRGIPVIIVSGKGSVEAAVECMKIGAVDYISKPFKLATIEATVTNVLRSRPRTDIRLLQTVAQNHHPWLMANYRIMGKLGEGNMGIVYLVARNNDKSQAKYALKIFKSASAAEPQASGLRQRFLNEIKAISIVSHPNVMKIVDFGHDNVTGDSFFVMEYIEGVTLNYHLAKPLNYRLKARMISQVASALEAIHKQNICHRDIKPSNILIDVQLNARIIDFGVAKMPDSELTHTAAMVGSPGYMAPEAFVSSAIDHRADIFSLGIVAYQFFAGQHPFPAHNLIQLAHDVQSVDPEPLTQLVPELPLKISDCVMKMIAKNPDDRFARASDICAILEAFAKDPTEMEI